MELGFKQGNIIVENHYLSNIAGLAIIGMSIEGISESERWVRAGIKSLEKEINHMVLNDGFFFESSTTFLFIIFNLPAVCVVTEDSSLI